MDDNSLDNITKTPDNALDLKAIPACEKICESRRCHDLDAYNWMKDIPVPEDTPPFYYAEVRFKNDHKEFYSFPPELDLKEGDVVAVEAEQGHDIGIVLLVGETVRFQMKRKGTNNLSGLKQIYRKARMQDIERWIQSVDKEQVILTKTRQIIDDLKLDMKLNDLEFRGDGTKAIFYYTANDRVDFRELIKILAERFRIKIEMRQIGVRQEAAKVGGLGSCGREMCCCTWISSFQSVSTQSARTQQLSLNPQKLAGQCGKLKCCLNYEQDVYADTIRYFPASHIRLKTKDGDAVFVKSDVFKKILYYAYNDSRNSHIPVALSASEVWKIIKMNEKGQFPDSLDNFSYNATKDKENEKGYESVNQDDLTRFDKPRHQNNRQNNNNNRRKRGNNNGKQQQQPQQAQQKQPQQQKQQQQPQRPSQQQQKKQ